MNYMLTSNEIDIANEWHKYKGYTVRPLPSTSNYYHDIISAYKDKRNFLMYGGTPEIRNIFQELNLSVTLVDRSEKIIRAMGRLTTAHSSIAVNESFIKTDWINFKLVNLFDLAIGDDAINMIPWDRFDTFLANTANALTQDGIFICHLLVKPDDNYINKNINDIYKEYKNKQIKSKYDLASRLNFICFDKNTHAMGWQKTINTLGKEKLDSFKPDLDFIQTFGLCNSQFYCPPQDEFEELANQYFDIKEIFYSHEHEYCLYEPIYLLEKKQKRTIQ